MPAVNPRRTYVSPLREESARRTRRAVLDAARELFVSQGYVATTVEQIARMAGVSRPTVFANAGNKRTILMLVRDLALAGDDEPVPVMARPWFQEALTEPDPARSVALHARNVVRVSVRYSDVDEVLRAAAGAEPELRELWRISEEQRRTGAGVFVDALRAKGPLKAGLGRDEAVDVLWALTSTDLFRGLVGVQGWPVDGYERWLAAMFRAQLLG